MAFLLLRVPSLKSPAGIFRWPHTYPGSHPSSRHHWSASTSREGCQAFATFRPQAFTASRRFPPPSGFTGLFHPAATSRVVAVQGLLSPRSKAASSAAHAPVPLSSRALTGPCPAVRFRVPPAAGCHTRGCLDFEAFLRARQRCVRFGVSLPAARSPLRFFLLQVVNHRLGSGSPESPAHSVVLPRLLSPDSIALSVFQRRARFLSLPRNQPARDFRAFRPKSPW